MSRFEKDRYDFSRESWGYEIQILDVHKWEQVGSIKASNKESYEIMLEDLKTKQGTLIKDILNLYQSS